MRSYERATAAPAATVSPVTIRLTVRTALWRTHVAQVVNETAGLVPVVKGNGYGFGRYALADLAAEFSDTIAVGTVHELDGLPDNVHPVVLTPTLQAPDTNHAILTVGNQAHVDALSGWNGRVVVKLASSMRRFGGDDLLVSAARDAGLEVLGVSLHPPIAGTATEHRDEVLEALDTIDTGLPVWLSHLAPADYASLPTTHTYRLRLGTALWHGDKSFFHLAADVLDVRQVDAGTTAGYHQGVVPGDGHLVMIGAGSANGVAPLDNGLSPFHHQQRRLALHERPHMHTSMVFVPVGDPLPQIGDWVDLQRSLITTTIDSVEWL